MQISEELLARAEMDTDFLKNIITGDEAWIYSYDIVTKRHSSHWKAPSSPRLKKGRLVKLNVKVVLIMFCNSHGIFHSEWLLDGQMVS
jgi:hypothetical protein